MKKNAKNEKWASDVKARNIEEVYESIRLSCGQQKAAAQGGAVMMMTD